MRTCSKCKSETKAYAGFQGIGRPFFCSVCGTWTDGTQTYTDPEGFIRPRQTFHSQHTCPHCLHVGERICEDGEEWCSECGLDPEKVPTSQDLAPLYKGKIRELLQKGKFSNTANKRGSGYFVRNQCGPNCVEAKDCPQMVADLTTCIQEYLNPQAETKKGSKRSRRRARLKQYDLSVQIQHNIAVETHEAQFHCRDNKTFEEALENGRENVNSKSNLTVWY